MCIMFVVPCTHIHVYENIRTFLSNCVIDGCYTWKQKGLNLKSFLSKRDRSTSAYLKKMKFLWFICTCLEKWKFQYIIIFICMGSYDLNYSFLTRLKCNLYSDVNNSIFMKNGYNTFWKQCLDNFCSCLMLTGALWTIWQFWTPRT